MFQPVSNQVDFPAQEREVLAFWKRTNAFEKLRQLRANADKRFSFIDGPITANNPMGVHHAWGRTYKDMWQRYKAMQGHNQRWQNGFDCQGLWVEVEVEKSLNLKSKREIETIGLIGAWHCENRSPSLRLRSTRRGQRNSWSPHRVGSIFRTFQKIFQDRAFQRRQFGRTALPRTRNIDAEIERDAAVLDDQHAVGERHGLGNVVGDQDRGEALIVPDPLEQLLHLDAGQRVERAERLVEREDARLADQRARQRHALLLAAGQHRRPLVALSARPTSRKRAARARACAPASALAAEADLDIRQHARPGQQPRLLEHDADVFGARRPRRS